MFSIEFPAQGVHVGTARIFSAAIARHFGADPADIDDLKIALTEACGSAISHVEVGSLEPVRVAASPGGGILTFEVNGHRRGELLSSDAEAEPTTEEQMIALSAVLIGALFPDAEFIDKPEG
ncbi:MAG: ATP-binding protein, partial [Actinomycetota bacterium]